MIIVDKFIHSDNESKFVHRIGTDSYFKKAVALKGDAVEQFEEIDSIPNFENKIDYNEEVNRLIREKYSLSEELAILRQRDTKADEFKAYNDYAEECKKKVRALL